MINLKDFARTISESTGIGRVHAYAIVNEQTTTETMTDVIEQGGEVKCFDFATYWRARSIIGGKRSVIFSCREKLEPGIIKKITQVTETGSPIIVNSLQKLRGAAIKKCKIIGVNITPHLTEPGISAISQLEDIVRDYGMVVRTVSYNFPNHKDIEELKEVLESIRVSEVLSQATIIDLGEYAFETDEEAAAYVEVLKEFRERHGDHFEYRFGTYI